MVKSINTVLSITGMEYRAGSKKQAMDVQVQMDTGQVTLSVKMGTGKPKVIKFDRLTSQLITAFVRRMSYDMGRAKRLL